MKAFYLIILGGLLSEQSFTQTTFQKSIWTTSEKFHAAAIEKIGDGCFVFIANGDQTHITMPTDGHYFISKIDSFGNLLWSKSFLNSIYSFGSSTHILKSDDSSFLITIGPFLFKYTNNGQFEFKKVFKDSSIVNIYDACKTSDKGVLFLSHINNNKLALIKTDSLCHVLWSRYYNVGFKSNPLKIFSTADGNYLLTGSYQDSLNSLRKIFTILVDSSGQVLNAMGYYRPGTQYIHSFAFDSTQSLLYFTSIDSAGFNNILGKIDIASGHLIWTKVINSPLQKIVFEDDTIYSFGYFNMVLKFDTAGLFWGSFYASGNFSFGDYTCHEHKIISISSNHSEIRYSRFDLDSGPLCSLPSQQFTTNSTTYFENVININSGFANFIDTISAPYNWNRSYVSYNSCIPQNLSSIENKKELFEIYPQPAHEYVSIKYKGEMQNDFSIMIFDIFGKLIDSRNIDFYGANPIVLSTQEIPRGSYIFCLKDKNEVVFRKPLILE